MTESQKLTGDAATGRDGCVHGRSFADETLEQLTARIDLWAQEVGDGLEIAGMSHSYTTGQVTALILWRLRPEVARGS